MSKASAKTYDVELWFPSHGRYRETASITNATDYQARRFGTRYRSERDLEPVHMLNGTAVVDRMALAILENFQGDVPDVLEDVRRARARHAGVTISAVWPVDRASRLSVVTRGTAKELG